MRRAFTLVELLVAIAVLTILAAVVMSALGNLEERAKEERTRTIIRRIDGYILEKWDSYTTRPLSFRLPSTVDPRDAALIRLRAIRDLMRMELPERASDIDGDAAAIAPVNLAQPPTATGAVLPAVYVQEPPTFRRYKRIVNAAPSNWAEQYQQSECLYMILAGMRDADGSPLDFLSPSEIGDLDNDGMKEILDGWGQPLYWWRWAPGYLRDFDPSTAGVDWRDVTTMQERGIADPFDTHEVDRQRFDPPNSNTLAPLIKRPFSLRPLIVSAGSDKVVDLVFHFERRYADAANQSPNDFYQNNPFPSFNQASTGEVFEAQPYDFDGDGWGWVDNITNHAP